MAEAAANEPKMTGACVAHMKLTTISQSQSR
jgi:hypothetical protein